MKLLEKLLILNDKYKIIDLDIEQNKLILVFKEPYSRYVNREKYSTSLLLKFDNSSQLLIKEAIRKFTICH